MFTFARVVLALYAVFLALGGALGYYRANSRPSLYAGTLGAALCLVALFYSLLANPLLGLQAGTLIALVLMFYFNYRFVGFKLNFMPAGLLALTSLAVFASLLISIL